ncbi:MAG: hypothetical protein PUB97_03845 [Ruminococcus sp.]|nr:hypothetical protein [Ruminococcus sp.]
MKRFLANVWTKRVCSIISLLYAACVCYLCYFSLFYDIHIKERTSLCLVISAVSLIVLVIMLYTRKQIMTRLSSFVILPAMLPVVLLYFGEWGMILPIIITGIAILLLSGAGEGAKTAIGTIILLMYIFGALGYFLFTSFFITTTDSTVIKSGVSPSGRYRYRMVNTVDASKGSTAVYIEPNYADKEYPFVKFTLKNMERIVVLERPLVEETDIQWTTLNRNEITESLSELSENIRVQLSENEKELIGVTGGTKYVLTLLNGEQKQKLGRKESDVGVIFLDELTDAQLAIFKLAKDAGGYYTNEATPEMLQAIGKQTGAKVYLNELTDRQMKYFNVERDSAVYLNDLTEQQLELLGIAESGDVMMFNGKICFRYYIAELENYYDIESRRISFDLFS